VSNAHQEKLQGKLIEKKLCFKKWIGDQSG